MTLPVILNKDKKKCNTILLNKIKPNVFVMEAGKETLHTFVQREIKSRRISSQFIKQIETKTKNDPKIAQSSFVDWVHLCCRILMSVHLQMRCIEQVGKEYRLFYNDLKPQNIIMDIHNKPKLIDLGSAYPSGLPSLRELKNKRVSEFLHRSTMKGIRVPMASQTEESLVRACLLPRHTDFFRNDYSGFCFIL